MPQNANQTQQQSRPQKKKQRKNGRPGGETSLTPAEAHANWRKSKIERAGDDNFNVVQQKTRDTAETVNFLNIVDNLMFHIRMNAGTKGSRLPEGSLDKFVKRNNEIKDSLNLLAAEMCRAAGRTYRPPRGYKDPLLENKQKAKSPVPPAKTPESGKAAKKSGVKGATEAKAEKTTTPHLVTSVVVPKTGADSTLQAAA